MNFIGNLIWLIFGGLAAALGYIFGGFILGLGLAALLAVGGVGLSLGRFYA